MVRVPVLESAQCLGFSQFLFRCPESFGFSFKFQVLDINYIFIYLFILQKCQTLCVHSQTQQKHATQYTQYTSHHQWEMILSVSRARKQCFKCLLSMAKWLKDVIWQTLVSAWYMDVIFKSPLVSVCVSVQCNLTSVSLTDLVCHNKLQT